MKMSETSRNRGMLDGFNQRAGAQENRFGRMFDLPAAAPASETLLRAIANAMVKKNDLGSPITVPEVADENPAIAAGYTYFGQFIDHDITFDPTPLNAAAQDEHGRRDFRSAALDLDSVYGRGPADQPYLYDGPFVRVGQPLDSANAVAGTKHDLLRMRGPKQTPAERPAVPLLGDKRNDENKIISQLHGLVIAFHNRIAGTPALITAAGGDPNEPDSVFAVASRLTRWHYQWVVLHDYIDTVCAPGTLKQYIDAAGNVTLPDYLRPQPRYAYMPVEFAVAAFRFGHSMIRPSYALNRFTGTDATVKRIPVFSRAPTAQNLNGFPGTVPDTWGIDWGYFLWGLDPQIPTADPETPALVPVVFQVPQPSYRIDAFLVDPLHDLPEFRQEAATNPWVANLAFRNLLRGQGGEAGNKGLPSGEAVSNALLGHVSVPADKMWGAGSKAYDPVAADEDTRNEIAANERKRRAVETTAGEEKFPLAGNTPLWYYILREAEYHGVDKKNDAADKGRAFGGQHLGPVGSRIVAQTLMGLLHMDGGSILNGDGKAFRPLQEVTRGFPMTLSTFVFFAANGA